MSRDAPRAAPSAPADARPSFLSGSTSPGSPGSSGSSGGGTALAVAPELRALARIPRGRVARPAPLVLQRTDQELIPAILDEMRTEEGRRKLEATEARTRDGGSTLRLFQPVHRTFHVVVLEAVCEGTPYRRVDPARILSAGLVVRRVVPGSSPGADARVEGWMRLGDSLRGWVRLGSAQQERDPDPQVREQAVRVANARLHPELRRLFADDGLAETVSPLFVAPPDVCAAAGRTLLYGLVPLTSTEVSEAAEEAQPYPDDALGQLIPPWLKESTVVRVKGRPATRTAHVWTGTGAARDENAGAKEWMEALSGLGLFTGTAEAGAVLAALDAVEMTYHRPGSTSDVVARRRLGEELAKADAWLQAPETAGRAFAVSGSTVQVWPSRWTIDGEKARAIRDAFRAMVEARLASVTPAQGRFDDPAATYRLRAFVRLDSPCGCGPELAWSDPSERFSIVPWYEGGAAAPARVTLPDASLDSIRKMKPNVAFVTPAALARSLSEAGGVEIAPGIRVPRPPALPGLDVVCGFSIPIITLCAFIVLQIFLALLNIIFWWLPFVKVCVPIPRPPAPPGGGGTP